MAVSRIGLFVLLLCIALLSSCSQKTHISTGESDNWKIQYEVKKSGGKCSKPSGESSGYIKYIGKSTLPESIEYIFSNSMGSVPLEKAGVFTLPIGCTNAMEPSEVIIKWDGKAEIIPLSLK
ncbi:hypothetical protein [Bacillus sp. B-jedd]|uniref:hypothetical protein n=1 Tax=Bacillus sp. B-jedd TaxID=1476857 RepID=UPI0005156519|nr:hypothetical protein [Bacillus sp. B-jedd]CEG27156.1 hypothetical protein BN1002_02012 [Bacillus sp. B-jedd]